MFELTVEDRFEAAHRLPAAGGACEELHSHAYKAAITVQADTLDETGVAVDFRVLRAVLSHVLQPLSHRYLNDLPAFGAMPPSAENIARFVFEESARRLKQAAPRAKLQTATVWESETASATYRER